VNQSVTVLGPRRKALLTGEEVNQSVTVLGPRRKAFLTGEEVNQSVTVLGPRRKALLTGAEVADLLRVTRWVLNDWRHRGVGPPYVRLAGWAIRYPWTGLVAYLQANLSEEAPKVRTSRPSPQLRAGGNA